MLEWRHDYITNLKFHDFFGYTKEINWFDCLEKYMLSLGYHEFELMLMRSNFAIITISASSIMMTKINSASPSFKKKIGIHT